MWDSICISLNSYTKRYSYRSCIKKKIVLKILYTIGWCYSCTYVSYFITKRHFRRNADEKCHRALSYSSKNNFENFEKSFNPAEWNVLEDTAFFLNKLFLIIFIYLTFIKTRYNTLQSHVWSLKLETYTHCNFDVK